MQAALLVIPAKGRRRLPVECLRLRTGQDIFETSQQPFDAGEELIEFVQSLAAIAGVDLDVIVGKIAGPQRGIHWAATQHHADGDV